MTPEDLEKLVMAGDAAKLAEAVERLTRAERRKLSKTASQMLRMIDQYENVQIFGRTPKPLIARLKNWREGRMYGELSENRKMAQLAVLAVCPISQTRRVSVRSCEDRSQLVKILCDRRPDWIDDWIEAKLNGAWFGIDWETVRELVRVGVAKKPASGGYVRLMVQGLPDRWEPRFKNHTPLSEKLLANSDLLEDELWRLFEVETNAFLLDYGEDNPHAPANYESWSTAISKLATAGTIDRQALLDATLSGLTTGFKNDALSGYIKLHLGLKPTLDELSVRQESYLDLLSSQASHVVTFALKMLKALEQGKRLDGPGLVESVGGVFDVRTKTQPKTALGLIECVVKREPELTAKAARLVADALMHESPDVQDRALKLLEGWADQVESTLATRLEERSDHVSATLRGRLEQLIARLGGSASAVGEESREVEANDLYEADLFEHAASLSPQARARAGVDAAVRSLESGDPLEPLDFDLLDVSVLAGAVPVEPIASVDDLVDAVAHAVEVVDTATEVERILDGISRLCDQRPEDFERRTAPLVKRINEGAGSETSRGLLLSWGVPRALRGVVMAWLRGVKPKLAPEPYNPENGARKAITGRLMELARRVQRRVAAPLLAAPTHAPGWIDPRRLVERLVELQESRLEVPRLELIQALLRLAPDGRKKARVEAEPIDGNVGRILRWALGEDETPTRRDRRDAPLWVAAGRSRAPYGRLEELAALGIHEEIPDAVTPATYPWRVYTESRKCPNGRGGQASHTIPQLKLDSEPRRFKGVAMEQFPSVALHVRASQHSVHEVHSPWLVQWISMLWPLNQDAFLAAGATTISRRIDMEASSFEPGHAFLEPLFEPVRPWSEIALLADLLGLISKDADVRRAAIDALVEGIQDGRVHPTTLSEVLVRLDRGGWVKLNRLAGALGEVARVSTLAQWTVARTLDTFMASLETMPRDVHHVLSLLLEVLTELGLGVSGAGRDVLKAIKGSSKTARLAQELLDLDARADSFILRRACLEALAGRIERASRLRISDFSRPPRVVRFRTRLTEIVVKS